MCDADQRGSVEKSGTVLRSEFERCIAVWVGVKIWLKEAERCSNTPARTVLLENVLHVAGL